MGKGALFLGGIWGGFRSSSLSGLGKRKEPALNLEEKFAKKGGGKGLSPQKKPGGEVSYNPL